MSMRIDLGLEFLLFHHNNKQRVEREQTENQDSDEQRTGHKC